MLRATLALAPVLQLISRFFYPFSSSTLLCNSGRGIRIDSLIMPVCMNSFLFLTSKCLTYLSFLNWSKSTIFGFHDSPVQSAIVKLLYPRMLKYPILKNLSAIYCHFPGSVKRTNSSSGVIAAASQLDICPLAGSHRTLPLIIDSAAFLVSTIKTFPSKPWKSSTDKGRLAFSSISSKLWTPVWLSVESWKKYWGGLASSEVAALTKSLF